MENFALDPYKFMIWVGVPTIIRYLNHRANRTHACSPGFQLSSNWQRLIIGKRVIRVVGNNPVHHEAYL